MVATDLAEIPEEFKSEGSRPRKARVRDHVNGDRCGNGGPRVPQGSLSPQETAGQEPCSRLPSTCSHPRRRGARRNGEVLSRPARPSRRFAARPAYPTCSDPGLPDPSIESAKACSEPQPLLHLGVVRQATAADVKTRVEQTNPERLCVTAFLVPLWDQRKKLQKQVIVCLPRVGLELRQTFTGGRAYLNRCRCHSGL